MTSRLSQSRNWEAAKPALSVLIPFLKDDPTALLAALQSQPTSQDIEILLFDDGTCDERLTARLESEIAASSSPICLRTNRQNRGRAAARNALQADARGDWLLFLDADMRPARQDFLQTYLDLIAKTEARIIFGGFEVEARQPDADLDLHRALSEVSDCLDLQQRQLAGPQFVASSNLCVRADLLAREPFDDGFSGWGWEDSEWAARVAKHNTLIHADNPAIHLGLETTDTLLRRFATSGPNYKRFVSLHPDLAPKLALYRISTKLGYIPGQRLIRPVLRALVKAAGLPMRIRLMALKLWRASHYAEALR